jgi:hypothetical protein
MLGTKYEILTDNGSLKRVTVEHGVRDVDPILELQAKLQKKLPGIKLKPKHDLHVTLFHFGQPEQIYLEIKPYNRHLAFPAFLADFLALIREYEHVVPEPFVLPAHQIEKFGNPKLPTVALSLHDHAGLTAKHNAVEAAFLKFLGTQGIENLSGFLALSSLSYQIHQPFKAHMSLGRLPCDDDLPRISTDNLQISLTRSRLRNVKTLEHGDWVWSH